MDLFDLIYGVLKSVSLTSAALLTSCTVAGASNRNNGVRLRSTREARTAAFTAKNTLLANTNGGSPTSFAENIS